MTYRVGLTFSSCFDGGEDSLVHSFYHLLTFSEGQDLLSHLRDSLLVNSLTLAKLADLLAELLLY
jgi:hypothetical protein